MNTSSPRAPRAVVLASAFALVLALALAPLPAQTFGVVPSQYATTEAPGLELEPLAYNRIRFVQYVDRSLLTHVPIGVPLTELAYRRDTNGYTVSPMIRTGRMLPDPVWRVRLGNTTEPALNPSATFPAVAAAGWTTVYTPKLTVFPAPVRPPSGPAAFDIVFPFDVPFVYTGGNLGIEHYCYETNNALYNYFADAITVQPSAGNVSLLTPTSFGCPSGENRAWGFAPNPGGTLQFLLYGAPASTVAFALLGFDDTSWGTYQLPLELSPFGLPSCWLYVDPIAWPLVTVDAGGAAEYQLPVPNQAAFASTDLIAQWAVVDPRVNPAFPLAASDGLRFTTGAIPGGYSIPMSIVSGTSNFASGAVGYVAPGRGPVFRLRW